MRSILPRRLCLMLKKIKKNFFFKSEPNYINLNVKIIIHNFKCTVKEP